MHRQRRYDDTQGQSPLTELAGIAAYPVQELGGRLWTYLGPAPAPELPKWDILVEPGYGRDIAVTHLPCSYLQCMENSLDPVHFEWLHAQLSFYLAKKRGDKPSVLAEASPEIRVRRRFEFTALMGPIFPQKATASNPMTGRQGPRSSSRIPSPSGR